MGITELSFLESVPVALFVMTITMMVLGGLYVCIRLFSMAFKAVLKGEGNGGEEPALEAAAESADGQHSELTLDDVDEPTAAAVMAIVSHESNIPLSQLRFKSIKPVK